MVGHVARQASCESHSGHDLENRLDLCYQGNFKLMTSLFFPQEYQGLNLRLHVCLMSTLPLSYSTSSGQKDIKEERKFIKNPNRGSQGPKVIEQQMSIKEKCNGGGSKREGYGWEKERRNIPWSHRYPAHPHQSKPGSVSLVQPTLELTWVLLKHWPHQLI